MNDIIQAKEIYLDLCGMHPPEPMELTLDALAALRPGQHVRILIDREPVPLFRILERNDYHYRCHPTAEGLFDILIRQAN